MSEPKVIDGTIAVDWWVLVGAVQAILRHDRSRDKQRCAEDRTPRAPDYNSGPDDAGFHISFYDPQRIGRFLGELHFTRGATATIVRGEAAPEAYDYCVGLVEALELLAGLGDNVRRWYEPSADEVIERYYHSRAQGSRVTLKQLAEQTGFSYSYLRTVKAEYDKAGKWGSKSKRLQGRAGTKSTE